MISIDNSYFEDAEEDNNSLESNLYSQNESSSLFPTLKCKKYNFFYKFFALKIDKIKLKNPQKIHDFPGKMPKKADSGAYNKWFMPANKRFFNKIEDKVLEYKKSPLFDNGKSLILN